ncbi:Monosaccharide-transporting ATPase [Thermobaculum terrenum ATCC BAA-798]|uniref:Xylose transport system permease protein XylH n=1 Tax=Thermobaculum terrenum (strain ATCC BAA-798 / CCMEE 7001 / YNP1) TaxID=525904 RepID=D1CIK8_THET1|nr:ABC transporter permease [Thermobaculum terrenum]ACZ43579.1 Monosaccharide-transporting ATPase [Thermobaculum terrenum ATCC BAA-798]
MEATTKQVERYAHGLRIARRVMARPELGAVAGLVLVFAIFSLVAGNRGFLTREGTLNYLEVAAQLGLVTVPVALLMIAGEFDLSVGAMVGASGVLLAILVTKYGWPLWAALLVTLGVAMLLGYINGYLVIRTGLPSFIITLGTMFVLRGATLGFTRLLTGVTVVSGVSAEVGSNSLVKAFTGTPWGVPASIFWWLIVTLAATWVLQRTPFGNWIFGSGGDPVAARNVGVPVARVKIALFMATSTSAALLAIIQVLRYGSADVLRGTSLEFQAIAASVIGGTLLTGGYGSAVGAALGALIFGMVSQGIFFTGINTDWFQVFLGAMLVGAVLFNRFVRRWAASEAH